MRPCALAVILALAVFAAVVGNAGAASEPRCCKKVGGPGGLPFTGVPLYVPVLASLGLIGAGVALRRRAREQV